ncbi:PAS domain S-box protein [Patulibacter defluvii]|uniref:PAS domain S-box protein n=1 Tax=Patulibacter defluvii TaxID=3095358 RepID=UPI002A74C918|nr:PAS domain S-box protein [Patulibacter sp. DM4]
MTHDEQPAAGPTPEPARLDGSRLLAELADERRRERTRLADALHDDALPRLFVLGQDLAEVRETIDQDEVAQLREQVGGVLAALRSLTRSLQEDALATLPLDHAIERIVEDVARRGRFAHAVTVDPAASGVHDAQIRDIVRELTGNAARHAAPSRVEVTVDVEDDGIRVVVADDGRGLTDGAVAAARDAGHLGLSRLDRAATAFGGRLRLEPAGPGLRATVWLPRTALAAQRRQEEELGEERRWAAALVSALRDALFVVRDGRVVQVNDALVQLTGYPRDRLVGQPPARLPFWLDDGELVAREIVRERPLPDPGVQTTTPLLRLDGTRVTAQCVAQAVQYGVGGLTGTLVVVRDLDELRQATERARAEEDRRTAIDLTRRLSRLHHAVAGGRDAVLDELALVLRDVLGWHNALLNLREPDRLRVVWASNEPLARKAVGTTYPLDGLDYYLQPRFERAGAFHVPEELAPDRTTEISWAPAFEPLPDDSDAEQPGDVILVRLRRADGELLGLLSVDQATSGRRPDDTQLGFLVAVADHAALALEQAGV